MRKQTQTASADSPPRLTLARYLAPSILVLVASVQIGLAYRAKLTPSKGGGFGLFSCVDNLQSRHLRAYVVFGDGRTPAAVPPTIAQTSEFKRSAFRATSIPTDSFLHDIASRIAEANREVPFKEVCVEIWRQRFDSSELKVSRELVADFSLKK